MKKRSTIVHLKQVCPMPVLLKKLGLGAHAKSSCKSPLRSDDNASWGIFQRNGSWFYKDHGTGDSGDEIPFLARYLKLDALTAFAQIVEEYERLAFASNHLPQAVPEPEVKNGNQPLPNRSGFVKGTEADIAALATLRGYEPHVLDSLLDKGLLVFGDFNGYRTFGITDSTGRSLEIRRLDGQMFPGYGNVGPRKSHSIRHSQKSWPVGITEANTASMILLCEGVPDYIAGWHIVDAEGAHSRVVPVTMLGAANKISADALPFFSNKHVRIAPHNDAAGLTAAKIWSEQLNGVAAQIDFISLKGLVMPDGSPVKDLDEYKFLHRLSAEERRVLQ
jgi:hypothetical protein